MVESITLTLDPIFKYRTTVTGAYSSWTCLGMYDRQLVNVKYHTQYYTQDLMLWFNVHIQSVRDFRWNWCSTRSIAVVYDGHSTRGMLNNNPGYT